MTFVNYVVIFEWQYILPDLKMLVYSGFIFFPAVHIYKNSMSTKQNTPENEHLFLQKHKEKRNASHNLSAF